MVSWRDDENYDHSSAFSDKVGMILGGLPTNEDVLPSALFIGAYALLFIPIIFRIKTHTITFGQLGKPFFFVLMRITTFALRIQLAADNVWNKHIFITELIFFRLGPIILTLALLKHLSNALLPYIPTIDSPNLPIKITLKYFVLLLTLLTHFCLGLTIAVAFDVKAAINGNPEARTKLHRSKEISIWLLCTINASIYFLTVVPFVLRRKGRYVKHLVVDDARERVKFVSIVAVCTFMMVVSGFKAAQLAAHGQSSHYVTVINMKILFYTVCCLGEYVACALLLALAWARIAPPPELLEAYCRLHHQSSGGTAGPTNRWPGPPGSTSEANAEAPSSMTQRNSRPISSRATGETNRFYDPEIPKGSVRQAKVVSVSVSDGARQHNMQADTYRGGAGQWSEINILGNSSVARPSATLARNVIQDTIGNPAIKSRSTRRTSANSLSTISEDCVEKEHVADGSMAPSVGNDTFMTCSPGSTLRGDVHRRTSSIDSLALPANLIPSHPNPNAVSLATSHLPRALSTPTSTPTESKPFDSLSLSSSNEAWRYHQPLTMIHGEPSTSDSTRKGMSVEPQIRTPLRATTFASHDTAAEPIRIDTSLSSREQQGGVNNVSEKIAEQPTTSCSVQSRWSEDSDDNTAHFHNSPSHVHGRFHHHLHRHRKPVTAESWDHEDEQSDDRSFSLATVLI